MHRSKLSPLFSHTKKRVTAWLPNGQKEFWFTAKKEALEIFHSAQCHAAINL
jgi:hypothetical protein